MSTKIDMNTVSILFYKAKNNVYSIAYVYDNSQYIVSNIRLLKRLLNSVLYNCNSRNWY